MGKKQALIEERRKVNEQIERNLNLEKEESDDDTEYENDIEQEFKIYEKQDEMIRLVQKQIFDYVKNNNLPLCEYLSLEDLEKYLHDIV